MAENTKLILVDYGELDVVNDIPIVLSFSLADIQDLSKRNAAFSKTIILPGSKKNMEILSHLYNVNVEFDTATFPIDRKIPAYILQNDVVVLQGFFKLQSVKKLSPSDISYDENIEFEAVVFGGQGSFYDYIKDHNLSDVDLSAYNHILNLDNVLASSAYTYTEGFKYIFQYNTAPYYAIEQMRPSVYVKSIWDRIFSLAGYSYIMDNEFQTEIFEKLLIPFNAKDLKITPEQQLERSAKVGITDAVTQFPNTSITGEYFDVTPLGINVQLGVFSNPFNLGNGISGIAGASALYLQRFTLEFDKTDDCFYNGALNPFDTSIYTFVAPNPGLYDITIGLNLLLELDFPIDYWVRPTQDFGIVGSSIQPGIDPKIQINIDLERRNPGEQFFTIAQTITGEFSYGDIIPYQVYTDPLDPTISVTGYTTGAQAGTFQVTSEMITIDLATGTELRAKIRPLSLKSSLVSYTTLGIYEYTARLTINGGDAGACNNTFFRIQSQLNNVAEGDIIQLSQCLPQKTKMSDFVKSISQMFNLYIDVDKNEPTKLYITPRSEYYDYNDNAVIDWTDKFQYDADYSLELLSELQERTLNFTWKTSKDIWNEEYFNEIKQLYGQYQVSFDNDFLVGEKKIELIFEPTPLVTNMSPSPLVNGQNMIVPALVFGVDSNPKILVDGGVIFTDTTLDIRTQDGVLHPISQYNYGGHFDNPYTPTFDINWNVNEKYLYNEIGDNLTLNNLYNTYYEDYVDLIQNSKLLTGYFALNEADIANLRFDVLYWIRDSYWILNKVTDYNISQRGLTKCEFIKTQNVPRIKTTTQKPNIVSNTGLPIRPVKPYLTGEGKTEYTDNYQPGNTGNVNYGNATKVDGWFNIINVGTTAFSVLGKENRVGAKVEGGSIVGDRNIVGGNSKSINIIGSRNVIGGGCERICLINCQNIQIPDGTKDVFLQGLSDRIFEKSDVSYVNEFIYFEEGFKINNSDVVDGGEDIVYTCDPQFIDNVVDSGLDETCFVGVDGAQVLDGTYDSPYL